MDLLDEASVQQALKMVKAEWGDVDVLVNNAIYQGAGTQSWILNLTKQNMNNILQANVVSPLLLVQSLLPAMIRNRRGTIINVVSGSALMDPSAPAGKVWRTSFISPPPASSPLPQLCPIDYWAFLHRCGCICF
jgi:NAD(P)-dependent dehydrogenase (short-subunit alcohol dehydrogenase family)